MSSACASFFCSISRLDCAVTTASLRAAVDWSLLLLLLLEEAEDSADLTALTLSTAELRSAVICLIYTHHKA